MKTAVNFLKGIKQMSNETLQHSITFATNEYLTAVKTNNKEAKKHYDIVAKAYAREKNKRK